MALCGLTQGFLINCRDNIGGVVEIFLANKPSDLALTQDASSNITAITGTGLTFYRYQAEKNTSFVNETVTNNRENQTSFVAVASTFILHKQTQQKRNEMMLLGYAGVVMIAKDRTGLYKLYGPENTLTVATNEASSGTALGDLNGYTINFVGEESALANTIDYAAFSALIG
jgi:hypothetical protein